ncbi:MAG: ferric iron uptake transcriptional regulator [Pseudomonadota bacterium]
MSNDSDLKRLGLKATGPRLKILEMFEQGATRHYTAEDIYKTLTDDGFDIGIATVYRVLTQFESAGLITKHRFEDGRAIYELNDGDHHDHVVCVQCGRVEEFVDQEIEKRQHEIATRLGYVITDHSLSIYGVCQHCQTHKN